MAKLLIIVAYITTIISLVYKVVSSFREYLSYRKEFVDYLYSIGDTEMLHLIDAIDENGDRRRVLMKRSPLRQLKIRKKVDASQDCYYKEFLLEEEEHNSIVIKIYISFWGITVLFGIVLEFM
jgi:hypothetical protein